MIEHPTCFIKKGVYVKLKGYNLDYKSASDMDFMIRAYKNNCKFKRIKEK